MVDLKIMSVAAEGGTGWRVPQFKILGGGDVSQKSQFLQEKSEYLQFFRIFNIFKTSDRKSRKRNQNLVEGGFSAPESPPPPVKTSWRRPGYKWNVSRPNAMFTNCQLYVVLWCQKNGKWCHLSKKSAFLSIFIPTPSLMPVTFLAASHPPIYSVSFWSVVTDRAGGW